MYSPTGEEAGSSSSLQWQQHCRCFTFADIKSATRDFDESLVIGRGGFGKVYKGTIFNGVSYEAAAVKRLDSMSNQGASEFWAEVKMLSKLRHCYLVSLIGYCNEGQEMILLYEYMPYGTLADHLHKLHTPLSWVRRLKICIEAARGLDYLHTGTGIKHGIIHRDVKSSNILLEKSWAAKISDLGLSKICPTNQQFTYVRTFVKGTFGYLDPDYFSTGRLTRKSDVYAFGVVLLEVLCRKRAVESTLDEEQLGLARWAQDCIKEGSLKQIIDPNLREEIVPKCLKEFARLADRCLHSHSKKRPTMAEVVVNLESVLALQMKTNARMHPPGITIFGRKVPMFLLPSNGGYSGKYSAAPGFQPACSDAAPAAPVTTIPPSVASAPPIANPAAPFQAGQRASTDSPATPAASRPLRSPNMPPFAHASPSDQRPPSRINEPISPPDFEDLSPGSSSTKTSGRGRRLETLDFNFYTDGGERIELFQFDFHIIRAATENFSKAIKTRGGGSYSMYKGRLQNGQGIAVKIFHYDSLQFCEQCKNEVSLLVKLEHKNLVRLLGYCKEGTKMFLVYEAALNASLEYFIFDPLIHFHLDWKKRYKIILGVAKGLLYLHKHAPTRILHCGVKPGNILLDKNLDPKISDFGLARSLAMDDTDYHDVNRICGTGTMSGYMAPEYLSMGHLSTKTDVFSFGVLVLETIGGQRNNTCFSRTGDNFVQNAWTNWWRGTYSNIVDLKMGTASICLTRYIQIGLLCVQDNAAERPTMDEVVKMLTSDSSLTLPVPKKPVPLVEDWVSEAWESDRDAGAIEEFTSKTFNNDHDSGAVEEFLSELCSR